MSLPYYNATVPVETNVNGVPTMVHQQMMVPTAGPYTHYAPEYVSYGPNGRCVSQVAPSSLMANGYYPFGTAPLRVGSNQCYDDYHQAVNKLYLPIDQHRATVRQETATNAGHHGPTINRAMYPMY
eukprot:TRINITY_DN17856_c1_g1_i1.p1 TRINITY_DN17856_c1_g1~~TRINITY_DN17856_c1_g1_i1.p1  ORF type:complete len:146 (+),score=24.89 TRINITY_DN17856_c1_g1_i1:62-439(+)